MYITIIIKPHPDHHKTLSNSYTMMCPPVGADYPRALIRVDYFTYRWTYHGI